MSTSSDIPPDAKEPLTKFDFRQEMRNAEKWLVQKGSIQLANIDKNDINKIVCLSEFVLGLKISGLSNEDSINSYRSHLLELIECLEAKKSELRNKDVMRVVAWAVLAIESTFDLNSQKVFDDNEKLCIKTIFNECVNNLIWMVNDVKSDEEFSVYDLASALWALCGFKSNACEKYKDVLNPVIDKGIEKLLGSYVEGEGYPFTNKSRVSRISSTAFVLFVLGEILKIHKIDYNNIDIEEKNIEENINDSINYLLKNYSLWMIEESETPKYFPYTFIHFTLPYVIAALFIHGHRVGFRIELIKALSELYNHRKDGGFSVGKGTEPFWFSTFDAIRALKTVEANIYSWGGLILDIESLERWMEENRKNKEAYESLEKENANLENEIRVKNTELKKRDEEIKMLQKQLLEKEKDMPFLLILSLFITTVIAVSSVLIEFNFIIHTPLWIGVAVVSIVLYLRSKSNRFMYIMCGVLTGVLIGGITSLYIAGEFGLLSLLGAILGALLLKIVGHAAYDYIKKWYLSITAPTSTSKDGKKNNI